MTTEKSMMQLSRLGFFALAAWLIAGTTISSCQKSQQSNADTTQQTTTSQPTPVSTTTTNYITEYPVYKTTSEKELSANKDTIASVRERLRNAKADLRAALDREEQALEKENAALQMQLESYKDQGQDAWMQFKTSFDRSMDSVRNSLHDLRQRMSTMKLED